MALVFPNNFSAAFDELINGSVIKGTVLAYEVTWGEWFWPIMFLMVMIMIFAKTESPGFLVLYSVLGNVALAPLLLPRAQAIFYVVLVFSFAMVLFKFYGSSRTG